MNLFWLASEHLPLGQVLIAQSGAAKTAVGYLLFILAVGLAWIVICRPSSRQWQYTEMEMRERQAKREGNVKRQQSGAG